MLAAPDRLQFFGVHVSRASALVVSVLAVAGALAVPAGSGTASTAPASGVIETLAGTGKTPDSGDGGPAAQAGLSDPTSVAADPGSGVVYRLPAANI